MFAMKKINAQINRTGDQNKSASPDKIKSTPVIMGFLTYRYGPLTTKVFGGFQGAGVPFPNRKKRRIVVIARNTPMTKNDIDATRTMMLCENAMFSSKKIKEMHKRAAGEKTVAVPGRRRILHSNDFIIAPEKNHGRIRLPVRSLNHVPRIGSVMIASFLILSTD